MDEPNILLKSNFINYPDKLFNLIRENVVWDERMLARKTASFGVAYNYSGISYPDCSLPDFLNAVCQCIAETLNFMPNNCLLNYYPDGRAKMGYHADSIDELVGETGIVIISLGATRTISFRSESDRKLKCKYSLENGSLLYMSQAIQKSWMHSIPPQKNVEERISLTFRCIKIG